MITEKAINKINNKINELEILKHIISEFKENLVPYFNSKNIKLNYQLKIISERNIFLQYKNNKKKIEITIKYNFYHIVVSAERRLDSDKNMLYVYSFGTESYNHYYTNIYEKEKIQFRFRKNPNINEDNIKYCFNEMIKNIMIYFPRIEQIIIDLLINSNNDRLYELEEDLNILNLFEEAVFEYSSTKQ